MGAGPRVAGAPLAVSRHNPSLIPLPPITIYLGVLRYKLPAFQAAVVTIQNLYRGTTFFPAKPAPSHNIISVLRHNTCSPAPSAHNTTYVLRYNSHHPSSLPQSQYTTVYCDTKFPATKPFLLQYNSNPLHTHVAIQSPIAIHLPLAKTALQNHHVIMQFWYCDTMPMLKWVVAHSIPILFFFCFFFHFFFSNISIYWKIPKKYIPIFFFLIFQNTQINL